MLRFAVGRGEPPALRLCRFNGRLKVEKDKKADKKAEEKAEEYRDCSCTLLPEVNANRSARPRFVA